MAEPDQWTTNKWDIVNEFINSKVRKFNNSKFHMSSKPISSLEGFPQVIHFKPKGLWYDCDGDWIRYLKHDAPEWVKDYIYMVHLNKSVILELKTVDDILDFSDLYAKNNEETIDWPKVSSKYAGIEICPYQWELRTELMWYYTWDIASGCIWNPVGVDIQFVGKYNENEQRVVSKDELLKGPDTINENWFDKSKLDQKQQKWEEKWKD